MLLSGVSKTFFFFFCPRQIGFPALKTRSMQEFYLHGGLAHGFMICVCVCVGGREGGRGREGESAEVCVWFSLDDVWLFQIVSLSLMAAAVVGSAQISSHIKHSHLINIKHFITFYFFFSFFLFQKHPLEALHDVLRAQREWISRSCSLTLSILHG